MTPEELRQQRIDDYLLGSASPAERAALDAERATNAELDRELRDSQLALDAIELGGNRELKARLQRLEAQLSGADAGAEGRKEKQGQAAIRTLNDKQGGAKIVALSPREKKVRPARRWLALAAALLLLLCAGYFLLQPTDGLSKREMLAYAEGTQPFPNIAYNVTRPGGATESAEGEAYTAYEAGDYSRAAEAFAALEPTPVTRFYLAQSLFAGGRYDESAAILEELARLSDFNLIAEVRYYLSRAYLGAGRVEEAKAALRAVIDTPNYPNSAEAQEILRQLE